MSLRTGQRIGPYEVTGHLGEGGMGEVYRATDTRLKRDVAIKVLPEAFTRDPERLARFEREAVTLAQLHHPHIASVFGLEESSGVRALVMEMVEGPTLADRLKEGRLPIEECLSIARQVAEALEEAHEKGIVHRDLKPANIKAPVDGKVKVLDFGLAKAMGAAGSSSTSGAPAPANSPTLTSVPQGTQLGLILGTAAYMAPEQARGGTIDRRADIWAFGVVLYEMLSGQPLFEGDTVSDILAGVLKTDIDLGALPAGTPAAVRGLLRRCLERNPRNRLRDIGDARIVLEETLAGDDARAESTGGPLAPRLRRLLPWGIALVALVAAVGLLASRPAPSARAARQLTTYGVLVPHGSYLPRSDRPILDLSADGRTLLFVVQGETRPIVMKRTLDRLDASAVAGTDGAEEPRLSPDERWIAFFADGSLKKVPVEGGAAVVLADARAPRGLAWARDGSLIYSPLYNGGLRRIPATGGTPVEITKLDPARKERSHRWPQVLPDGRTVIFTVGDLTSPGDYDGASIDAVNLETGARTTILKGARTARYTPAGYLLYQQKETLMAARFDAATLELTGDPFVVQERAGGEASSGAAFFAVSDGGAVAIAPVDAIPTERVLVLVDPQGHETELAVAPADYNLPRVSPDGKTLAVAIGSGASAEDDIWLIDLATQRSQRLTFNQGHGHPIWSRDGKWITYTKGRSGEIGFASKAANGSGGEILLRSQDMLGFADAWLPGGDEVLITDASQSIDVRVLEIARKTIRPLFASATAAEYAPSLSPDDRYVAYTSTESGTEEVFVETMPPGGGRWQVSTGGGTSPVWSRDGRELYFIAGDRMMAADVDARGVFRSGAPRALFSGPYDVRTPPVRNYDVSADGRFVLIKRKFLSGRPRELLLIDGWTAADGSHARAE